MKMNKIKICKMDVIRALQLTGYEHEEVMAIRQAMETGDFSKIEFVEERK